MIIIMGVSGCGKTTIGKLLGEKVSLPFYDADDFHPKTNVDKMKQGLPLTDTDRQPWLELLADKMKFWDAQGGAILSCSALKEKYRQTLTAETKNTQWIYLSGSFELIQSRLLERKGHYMPADLLQSQFDTLEEPAYALKINITTDPDTIVQQIISTLQN